MSDEGYAPSFRALMEETDWEKYGVGRHPKCDNYMAHCGFEGTAVDDAFSHPLKLLKTTLFGPKTDGPMAPELPFLYAETAGPAAVVIPVSEIKRRTPESQQTSGLPQ